MLSIQKIRGAAVLLLILNKIKRQGVKKLRVGYPVLAVVASLLSFGGAAYAQDIEVSIRTTDASGAPMANVDIATQWWLVDGKLTPQNGYYNPSPYPSSSKTDASGRATLKMPTPQGAFYLMAYDKERRHSGYAQLLPGAKDVEISLRPVAIVRQKFNFKDKVDFFPSGVYNMLIQNQDGTKIFWGGVTLSPDNEVPLPAGSYSLRTVFSEVANGGLIKTELQLEPGQHLTLDPREIELSDLAKNYGKPALPISVSEARGLNKPFRLEDYRGKWVFLEFWHRGCGPCIGVNLPAMIKFYDKHADKRDKFEVFAFHASDNVKTLKELDTYLPGFIKNAWGGRSLPFPILLDGSGQTARTWGISGYPTEILIDPQGCIVRTSDAKKYLEEQLMKR